MPVSASPGWNAIFPRCHRSSGNAKFRKRNESGADMISDGRSGVPPRSRDDAAGTLGDDAFARLMAPLGPFEPAPHVAVAVSGGADSLALTLLADRWARTQGGGITALTV